MVSMDLYDLLVGPFVEFGFMRRALAGCLAVAIGGAPLGVFLVLRRMSLIGDAMAHAILPGAAIAFMFAGFSLLWMTLGGLAAGLAVALLAGASSRATAMREDAGLAAFYLSSLALGVMLVSLYGSSVDVMRVLFGAVLAMDDAATLLMAGVASVTALGLAALYRPLALDCFDPAFLRAGGRSGALVHFAFLALVVLNLVSGFQALGTLMAVGLMMLPAVSARFWSETAGGQIVVAVAFAALASFAGLLVSFHAGVSSGPAIVLSAGALFLVSLFAGPQGGLVTHLRHR